MTLTREKPSKQGVAMRLDWFVVNVFVLFLNNPRYIFIVRRLSNVGIIPTVYELNSTF